MAISAFAMSSVAEDGRSERQGFTLYSPDLAGGSSFNKFVLTGFGCSGSNVSPELRWSHVRPGTQSFALQFYDAHSPTGSGFWHWAVYNIRQT